VNPAVGAEQSYVHPLVACGVLLAGILILSVKERNVMVPLLSAGILIPLDEVAVLGPFHFPMLRILILLCWLRLGARRLTSTRPMLGSPFNALDALVLSYAVFDAIGYVLLWNGSTDAIVNRSGSIFTIVGLYFLFRTLIRDQGDINNAIEILAYVCVVVAAVMFVERATGSNPYVLLGGPRAWTREALMSRSDKFRAMGPFEHPILAGTFGAICLPGFISLWITNKKRRIRAVVGILAATLIVLESASSTPMMSYAFGAVSLALWPLRKHMRQFRWSLAMGLITLHLVMKAPVWALIQRIDLTGGSSSYHRYQLVDQTIRHFGDWWLLGVKSTNDWGDSLWDHADQYVAIATGSGLLPLILFIAIISVSYQLLGRARRQIAPNRNQEFVVWTLGAMLTVNVIGFLGISYVDQTSMIWWMLIAMIPVSCIGEATTPVSESLRERAGPEFGRPYFAGATNNFIARGAEHQADKPRHTSHRKVSI
jgi:hypothetical protein